MSVHPVFELVGEIQRDLERANARFQALRAHLAAENLAPIVLPQCPVCGPLHLPPTVSIDEHLRNVHDVNPEAVL